MSEKWPEQLSRVRQMVEDDGETWDLSDNDKAALKAVLARLDAVNSAFLAWHTTPDCFPSDELLDAMASLSDE